MRFLLYFSLAVAAVLATASLGRAQTRDQQTDERPTASDNKARKAKIEALTLKQKVTDKEGAEREEVESKASGSKTSAPIGVNEPGVNRAPKPIGVNEPGVNRAPKPITVTEEGVENQPTKGNSRSVEPTKQAGPQGKPGKGEPQPAKKH